MTDGDIKSGDIEGKGMNAVQRVFVADDATDRCDAPPSREDS
ncbi:hypothetical protein [Streptomyces sp. NPDC006147]